MQQDQLGSTRLITSATGTLTGQYSYDAYGKATYSGTVSSPLQFAGQYADSESGLYWMRARYYDPTTGQFVSRDALTAATRSPYAYANGDPVDGIDPTGLSVWNDIQSGASDAVQPWRDGISQIEAHPIYGVEVAAVALAPVAVVAAPVVAAACLGGGCEAFATSFGFAAAGGAAEEEGLPVEERILERLMPGGEPIGVKGTSKGVRILPGGINDAKALFDELAVGCETYVPKSSAAEGSEFVSTPNGGVIGLRPVTGTANSPAIGINNIPGLSFNKIHFTL